MKAAGVVPEGEELLLNPRQGLTGHRCRFVGNIVVCDCGDRQRLADRDDADGADAIGAKSKKKPKVVLGADASCARLPTAEPTLGTEMFKERDETAVMMMIACRCGKSARDGSFPGVSIDKVRGVIGVLCEDAGVLAFEQDRGVTAGDRCFLKLSWPPP